VTDMDDQELLREYVGRQSQDAFRQLVERHLPMVYSAARRIVHDAHLAEEVAQNVFATFARKARIIRPPQVIGGWLYNTTRHLAFNAVRGEQRRREREQTAIAMQTVDLTVNNPSIDEHLEPAMAELEPGDRDALVLRYLENRTLREVGVELGVSEDAARMRVNRALDRLRTAFDRRGVTAGATILAAGMTAGGISVPAGLAATITAATIAPTGGLAAATFQMVTTAKVKLIIAAALSVSVLVPLLLQQRKIESLRVENNRLRNEMAHVSDAERSPNGDQVLPELGSRPEQVKQLRQDRSELLRLRGEVGLLRRELAERRQNQGAKTVAEAQAAVPELPVGSIKFVDYDVQGVLPIYAELAELRLNVEPSVIALKAKITLENTQALTRLEAVALVEQTLRDQAGVVVIRSNETPGEATVMQAKRAVSSVK